MRTNLNTRGMAWRRGVAALAVAALPIGIMAATMGPASAHEAPGSPVEAFVATSGTGSLTNAIQNGWWGHEGGAGGAGTLSSVLDLNIADSDFAGLFSNLDNVRVAFVQTSADGSAEKPNVTAGQSVGDAYPWFMDAGFEQTLNGDSSATDFVQTVSTKSEFNTWFDGGQPLQGYNSSLQMIDIGPNTVAAKPQGKSILNRWVAGSNISMVFYESTGAVDTHGEPVMKVGSDGKAISAYMAFTTVAKPGDAVRTSAGYQTQNFGATAQNTTTTLATNLASPQPSATPIDLTATVAPASGTDVPVGSVEFFNGATSLGTATLTGGTATLPNKVLAVGSHTLKAVYTPTNTQTLAFNTSTSANQTFVISASATTTAAGATPGADVTAPVGLTATVTPAGVTGTVVWKDGGVTIAGPTAIDAAGLATATKTFNTPGLHSITAIFTPDAASSDFAGSQGSVDVTLAAPSGVSVDTQTVTGTIPVGTITVTTPYTPANPLDLGELALTPSLNGYKASATFEHIHVLDTRSGAQDWDLTALAGNLGDGAGHFINGQNLGLTDLLPETTNVLPLGNNNPGLGTITATDNPVPAAPVAPGDTGLLGLGGATPHTVLHADQGPSDAWYSGTLTLFAPTTSVTGLYTGTITFTAS
jgi:hypothetical protein